MGKRKLRSGFFIKLEAATMTLLGCNVLKDGASLLEKCETWHILHESIFHATLRMLYATGRV